MNLLLKNHQSIGDILMLTACVRDLKRWYPEFNVKVSTSCDTLFENNPYLSPNGFPLGEPVIDINMEYPLIHKLHEKDVHFLHGFIDFINEKLSLRVKLTEFKADIHLTDKEKLYCPVEKPYWLMVAGGKGDFTAKHWWQEAWQAIVDKSKVKFVTIGGKEHEQYHCKLNGVIDFNGKTTVREAISLICNSEGVISPVTFAMHTAAVFDKKCVVIAGGREHWYWEKYPGHIFLHTIGSLDCCKEAGCWKNECENKNDKNHQKCLELIDPKEVSEIINGL